MNIRRMGVAAVAVVAAASFTVPSTALPRTPQIAARLVPHEVVVRFRAGSSPAARARIIRALGAVTIDRLDAMDAVLLRVPGDVSSAVAALGDNPAVAAAEPNLAGRIASAPPARPDDPYAPSPGTAMTDRQWYLSRIGAPYAWAQYPRAYYTAETKAALGSRALKVAVLDTWIDTTHTDFANTGGDAVSSLRGGQIDTADATSLVGAKDLHGAEDWHGTHIAGVIGAAADNGRGITGVAYHAQIMPVVVANGDGTTNAFRVAKGVVWATAHGARVINISLFIDGAASSADLLRRALDAAVARGAVVVAAAGNGPGAAPMPAVFASRNPGILAVGATDIFDGRAACSRTGAYVSIAAPGDAIWSLQAGTGTGGGGGAQRKGCGTSHAAAIVSGVAALVAARYPALSPASIARRITMGADDVGARGRDDATGAGRVNAERTLWPGGGAAATWVSIPPLASDPGAVTATASSASGVSAAEVLIDGARRGRGITMRPAGGRWGRSVRLVAAVNPAPLSEGIHEIQVRARDARGGWGPASSGVLVIDRTPPSIAGIGCGSQGVLSPDDPGSAFRFAVGDAWSRTMTVAIDLLDASIESQARFRFSALPAAAYQIRWEDVEAAHGGPLTPGPYRIVVAATDAAGNGDWAEGPCAVSATPRAVPSPDSIEIPGAPGAGQHGAPTRLPTARPTPSDVPDPGPVPTPTITPSP